MNLFPGLTQRDAEGHIICPQCGKHYIPDLGERQHPELLIQQEFPNAEPYQREQLVTGICSDRCWDAYLGVGDDDE